MTVICTRCGVERRYGKRCLPCKNAWQRVHRKIIKNRDIKIYEKTKKGFLVRLYRNMKSRIEGIQKQKFYLYRGKALLPKSDFYNWALKSKRFDNLFNTWKDSGFDRRLTPSVDRINPDLGYIIPNMEWVTHSENSRRGAVSWMRKYYNQWRRKNG